MLSHNFALHFHTDDQTTGKNRKRLCAAIHFLLLVHLTGRSRSCNRGATSLYSRPYTRRTSSDIRSTLDHTAPVYLQENNYGEEARFKPIQHVDMVTQDGLVRIFWPSEAIKPGAAGVLVGWRNSDSDITVAAILLDVEVCHSARVIADNTS